MIKFIKQNNITKTHSPNTLIHGNYEVFSLEIFCLMTLLLKQKLIRHMTHKSMKSLLDCFDVKYLKIYYT